MAATTIASQIERINADKIKIRNKLIELGLATSNSNLDELATKIASIINQGKVQAKVQIGKSYTIPAGYHTGGGTVEAVEGEGQYDLQKKSVTPTKDVQEVTSDAGFFGLSSVTVGAIPDAYQDVSDVDVTAPEVLTGKIFVTASGTPTTGTMANNGAVHGKLDTLTIKYTIPKGYHDGLGDVVLEIEEKTATPTKETQTIQPAKGKVLSAVTVNPIPAEYITTTDATATAGQILDTQTAYVNGEKVTGTMPNNGAVSQKLTTTTKSYTVPAGYHSGKGTVSIDTETKDVVPTKSVQAVTPTENTLLSQVTIQAIPAKYQDVTPVTATGADVLAGKSFVNALGEVVPGEIPNNGDASKTFNVLETTSVSVAKGYTTGGTVGITDDLENALAAI